MISYNVEILDDNLINELLPILELHRQELSKYDDMILNPEWNLYYKLQESKMLEIYIARDENNNIVGYTAFFLLVNPHYCDFTYAHQDVFYVVKDKRTTRIAYNLIKFSEKELNKLNISVIVHHTKLTNRFGDMLSLLGYNKAEVMYHKRIN